MLAWLIRVEIVPLIGIIALSVPMSKRVIVAWLAYFNLRRHPHFNSKIGRQRLWNATLKYADGKTLTVDDFT